MRIRRVIIRTADDSGQQRRFSQIQILDVFAEISASGFAKTIDGKSAALTQINLVAVHGHDLFLAQFPFQDDGHVGFG